MTQRPAFYPLRGGLDLITPAIEVPPGRAIGGANYEPLERGYGRILGYERLDGRPKPSASTYSILRFNAGTAAIAAGSAITGVTDTVVYQDDFSADTSDEWAYAGQAVDGTISVVSGSLRYTVGAGDGAQPRIAREIPVIKGRKYRIELPAPTGTVGAREMWVSSDGGSFVDALTTVASNAALDEEFTAPIGGFGVVWIVVRAGTGNSAGETVEISEAKLTLIPDLAPDPVYDDDFSADTSSEWAYAGEAVNGVIAVTGGNLRYTVGASDGARPRIVRPITVEGGREYEVELPAPTGTAPRRELWVSSDGGSIFTALTPVAVNETLVATFTAPADGFGTVWIVLRAGTGSDPGDTIEITSAKLTPTPDVVEPTPAAYVHDAVLEGGSYAGGDASGYLVVSVIAGTFRVDDEIQVDGVARSILEVEPIPDDAQTDAQAREWKRLAREYRRSLIEAVPGSGPVRGVWAFGGSQWAIRDNASATSAVLYRSSADGWVMAMPDATFELPFDAGTAAFTVGETVTGTTSSAAAEILRVIVDTGDWGDNDAAGRLIIGPITGASFQNNEAITSAGGAAVVNGEEIRISLPPGGRYEFLTYNFTGASETQAMYFTGGVGRAMEYKAGVLTPLRTGLPDALDKPSRIAAIANHLILGFASGSLQVSAIGDPIQWQVVLGAGEIALGEPLTGLLAVVDGSLVVTGHTRIAVLYGRSTADFQLRTFSDDGGAMPSTLQRLGDPLYLDDQGVRSLAQTQAFGNFLRGTATRMIEPLMRKQLAAGRRPVASFRIRAKDQYRLIWDNGTGLMIHLGREGAPPECMTLDLQGMIPSCFCSVKDGASPGIILFGAENGFVYEMEAGNSFDGEPITSFIRMPFNHVGHPTRNKRWHKATLETDASPTLDLKVVTEVSYGDPLQPGGVEQNFSVSGGGGFWNEVDWNDFYWSTQVEGQAEVWIDRIGFNLSVCAYSSSADEPPHLLHGLTLHYTFRSLRR